jgi:hypothetical protein
MICAFVVGSLCSTTQAQSISARPTLQNNPNKIEIYPNPSVEFLFIKVGDENLNNIQFELHSIIGNQIKTEAEEIRAGVYRIPVAQLTKGYYFIVLTDEENRFKQAFKFLKQ